VGILGDFCRIFLEAGGERFFVVLWAFLRGVGEKLVSNSWCFCGGFVVKGVP
jgi:hypothetical protein